MEHKLQDYLDYLVKWIRKSVKSANCKGAVVGLSGGIDSAVVALLAQRAFPDDHLTVLMPCNSNPIDEEYALKLVNTHNLRHVKVDLSSTYNTLLESLPEDVKSNTLSTANIKPRLRMITLYSLAQTNQYLVLGTDNADEWHIGYFTKYGDGAADLVPIIHLLKREVREAAKLLGVNEEIIARKPTAGLWEGQTDEDELGFNYEDLDNYLSGKEIDSVIISKIMLLHKNSMHKRTKAKAPRNKINFNQ